MKMARTLFRGMFVAFFLNALMVEQSEAGVVKPTKSVDESITGHIVATNEAILDTLTSEANAKDTRSEEESALKMQSMMLYQGDIVLDEETYNLIKSSKNDRTKRNAHRSKSYLWTSRIIPYQLPPSMAHIQTNLMKAFNEIHQKTCLRFVPYNNGHKNYIYFDQNRGCSSMIGKLYHKAGKQTVSLGKGCNNPGTILHELLHAIGFWHEQARPDRDKYVKVNFENIADVDKDQFCKYDWRTIDDLDKDYDLKSIMHYGRFTFSKNGKPTIEALHDKNFHLGNDQLSKMDAIEINALYDCDTNRYGWTAWSSFTPCDNMCYKTRQRYCYHPKNDYSHCAGANPYGIQKDKQPCSPCPVPTDGHWGDWGPWTPCTATCDDGTRKRTRQCNNPAPAKGGKHCPGSAVENDLCMITRCKLDADDTDFEYDRMGIWRNTGDDNFDWSLLKGPTQTYPTGPYFDHTSGKGHYLYTESSAPRVKGDTAKLTTQWLPFKPGGQCIKFAYHMFGKTIGSLGLWMEPKGHTKYYLFFKKGSQQDEYKWNTAMGNVNPPQSVPYRLIFEAVIDGTGYSDIAIDDVYIDPGLCDCQDEYVSCQKWAASGECSKNANWMAKHCKRSCLKCKDAIPTTRFAGMITTETEPLCSDNDPLQCPLWADRGECTINPTYMNKNCEKSCGICGCKDSNPVQCPLWAGKGICKSNPAFMLVKCIKSCNVCRCHDNNVSCIQWASRGECTKNPIYMKPNCKRSCKVCK